VGQDVEKVISIFSEEERDGLERAARERDRQTIVIAPSLC